MFGDMLAHIPQVVVISTSLGALPRPVPRPLPGVTPPASPECPTPLSRGWLLGCRRVACWWPLLVSVGLAFRVFEIVGMVAGRGVGRRVACSWPWLVSVGLAFRVFDVVVMFDGRGVGRGAGRRCVRWCVPQACSMVWARLLAEDWVMVRVVLVVAPLDFKRVRACSMSWTCSVAVVRVEVLVVAGVGGAGYLRVRWCSRVWPGVLTVV